MKSQFAAPGIVTISALLAFSPVLAGEQPLVEKTIILDITNDQVDLHQVDISDLTIGEAETIFTEDGKTVDILRTQDGFEIYVDGEELEIPMPDFTSLHRMHSADHIFIDTDIETHAIAIGAHEGTHDSVQHKVIVVKHRSSEEDEI